MALIFIPWLPQYLLIIFKRYKIGIFIIITAISIVRRVHYNKIFFQSFDQFPHALRKKGWVLSSDHQTAIKWFSDNGFKEKTILNYYFCVVLKTCGQKYAKKSLKNPKFWCESFSWINWGVNIVKRLLPTIVTREELSAIMTILLLIPFLKDETEISKFEWLLNSPLHYRSSGNLNGWFRGGSLSYGLYGFLNRLTKHCPQ